MGFKGRTTDNATVGTTVLFGPYRSQSVAKKDAIAIFNVRCRLPDNDNQKARGGDSSKKESGACIITNKKRRGTIGPVAAQVPLLVPLPIRIISEGGKALFSP